MRLRPGVGLRPEACGYGITSLFPTHAAAAAPQDGSLYAAAAPHPLQTERGTGGYRPPMLTPVSRVSAISAVGRTMPPSVNWLRPLFKRIDRNT